MQVREAQAQERRTAVAALVREWGDPIVVRDKSYLIDDCQIFVAGEIAGVAAVSFREHPVAELVAITAFRKGQGVGTALLRFVLGACTACKALRLTTTNDNVDALRFYQRRGFRLDALRPGAVTRSRRTKPSIPLVGAHGIPLRDEIDLVLEF